MSKIISVPENPKGHILIETTWLSQNCTLRIDVTPCGSHLPNYTASQQKKTANINTRKNFTGHTEIYMLGMGIEMNSHIIMKPKHNAEIT